MKRLIILFTLILFMQLLYSQDKPPKIMGDLNTRIDCAKNCPDSIFEDTIIISKKENYFKTSVKKIHKDTLIQIWLKNDTSKFINAVGINESFVLTRNDKSMYWLTIKTNKICEVSIMEAGNGKKLWENIKNPEIKPPEIKKADFKIYQSAVNTIGIIEDLINEEIEVIKKKNRDKRIVDLNDSLVGYCSSNIQNVTILTFEKKDISLLSLISQLNLWKETSLFKINKYKIIYFEIIYLYDDKYYQIRGDEAPIVINPDLINELDMDKIKKNKFLLCNFIIKSI